MVPRAELRDEVARLLGYLVPAGFGAETVETVTVPAFRPLSFLTALAERVIPDSEPVSQNGASAPNGQASTDGSNGAGSVPSASDGEARRG